MVSNFIMSSGETTKQSTSLARLRYSHEPPPSGVFVYSSRPFGSRKIARHPCQGPYQAKAARHPRRGPSRVKVVCTNYGSRPGDLGQAN
jgi:hypothetical protein